MTRLLFNEKPEKKKDNMDYERRYNSALERAKYALTTDMDNSGHWACTYIFPELKKTSEKEIIQYLVEECESILANSDFINLERTAKAENAIGWLKKRLSDDGVHHEDNDTDKSTPRKGEMVVNILKTLVSNWKHETKLLPKYTSDEGTIDAILEWLETMESSTKNLSLAEKEKEEFVCNQFLYCRKSLGEGLNEGEKYWLEYVGDDTYVGRSDNRDINAALNILAEGERTIGSRRPESTLVDYPTMDERGLPPKK